MHIRAGVVVCVALALSATAAWADTFYRYRDEHTGRDVFVNRLDQVPQRYRRQAKVVLEATTKPGEAKTEPATEDAEEPPPPVVEAVPVAAPADPTGDDLRRALTGNAPWKDGPALAGAAIDAKLVKAGRQPLTGAERADLGRLLVTILIASIVAGLAALAIWIVIIVTAVRDKHPWWALLIILFSPLAYVYLFLRTGKERALFKTLCSLGMLSPALVGLVGAWRFYAWFHAVVQARGGRI